MAIGPCACGFGTKSRATVARWIASCCRHAPLAPKPGHLTRSPCLNNFANNEFVRKKGASPRLVCASSYQYRCKVYGRRLESGRQSVLLRVTRPATQTPGCRGFRHRLNRPQGVVIGSGDRALGCKACVYGPWRADSQPPRVIAPQNRMHLTQSPRRVPRHPIATPCTEAPSHHAVRRGPQSPRLASRHQLPRRASVSKITGCLASPPLP